MPMQHRRVPTLLILIIRRRHTVPKPRDLKGLVRGRREQQVEEGNAGSKHSDVDLILFRLSVLRFWELDVSMI